MTPPHKPKKSVRRPKAIDGGETIKWNHSCYHLCIQGEAVRFQADAGSVYYTQDPSEALRLSKWLAKAAEYLRSKKT